MMTTFLRTFLVVPLMFCLAVATFAQPMNDDCANATTIGSVTDQAFSTIDATTGEPYHPGACTGGTADSLYNDIWYLFTADFTGVAEFSTCGTADFDTNVAAYAAGAACPPTAQDVIACNEDGDGCSGFTSRIVFAVEEGESYLLRIGGWGTSSPGEEGTGTFSVGSFVVPNDECDDAIAIDGSASGVDFVTVGATSGEPYHPMACTGGTADSLYNDIWYLFTPDFTGTAEFTTCGTANFDTNVAAYAAGSSCPPTAGDVLACNEDGAGCDGFTSVITFDVTAGESYLLRIGGWGNSSPGEEGLGTFSVGPFTPPGGPPNDDCADAEAIGSVTDKDFTTLGATTDGPYHPTDCTGGAADSLFNDIWYAYTADFTGTAEFTTCGTAGFDTNLAAYAAGASCPPEAGDLLACNEDGAGCAGFTSKLTFDVVDGETYLLRIGGWGSAGGPGESGIGTFSVGLFVPPIGPPNDDCFNATPVGLQPMDTVTMMFSTNNANTSEPSHTTGTPDVGCLDPNEPVPYNDIWYSWTATFTGWVEYSVCGLANFDSKIAVYGPNPACPPDVEELYACSDDEPGCLGFTSATTFQVEEDSTYLFRLGGWSASDAGTGTVFFRQAPPPIPPANDLCMDYDTAWVTPFATADDLDPVFSGFTNNGSSDLDNPVPTCMQGNEYSDTWYKFNSGNNTELTIRIFKFTGTSQFVLDLFDDCMNPTDPANGGFCFNTVDDPLDFVTIELENFPGTPTEFFLRISTDFTFENPGEFFFQILGEPYTGTDEVFLDNFKFFPNPTSGELNIQFDLERSKEVSVEIFNPLGQLAQVNEFDLLGAGSQKLQVSVEDLQPGIYFFKLNLDDGQKTIRFVKE